MQRRDGVWIMQMCDRVFMAFCACVLERGRELSFRVCVRLCGWVSGGVLAQSSTTASGCAEHASSPSSAADAPTASFSGLAHAHRSLLLLYFLLVFSCPLPFELLSPHSLPPLSFHCFISPPPLRISLIPSLISPLLSTSFPPSLYLHFCPSLLTHLFSLLLTPHFSSPPLTSAFNSFRTSALLPSSPLPITPISLLFSFLLQPLLLSSFLSSIPHPLSFLSLSLSHGYHLIMVWDIMSKTCNLFSFSFFSSCVPCFVRL